VCVRVRACMCACTCVCMRARVRAFVRACVRECVRLCVHASVRFCACVRGSPSIWTRPRGNCSYVPTPPPHTRRLFLDFGEFFSQMTLIFLVNTIRQVIWPSPGTLGTHTNSSENAAGRVKEQAEAGGHLVANVRQPVFCHFIQRNFASCRCLFSPAICVCATFSLVANAAAAACG